MVVVHRFFVVVQVAVACGEVVYGPYVVGLQQVGTQIAFDSLCVVPSLLQAVTALLEQFGIGLVTLGEVLVYLESPCVVFLLEVELGDLVHQGWRR